MIQIKKTILTLVALLAVTTGAWATDGAILKELTVPSEWNNDETYLAVDEMTGFKDFSSLTEDEAKALLNSVPAGQVAIIYGAGASSNSFKLVQNNGADVYVGETTISHRELFDIKDEYKFYYTSAAPAGPTVDWDKAEKSGTFTMPGGNVELEPEYYPQAALTAVPTAINDVPATTDGAIVNAGTVANIGSTETAQGTVMYYVSPTALDDAALLALDADAWTADVPTAESFTAAGTAHVYYYVRGNDSDTDDEIFSDGDILSTNALTVTIAAAPTYAVTFADDLAEPDKWTASPNANVTKGETVTVTYTGSKKVIGVKAEKKAAKQLYSFTLTGPFSGTQLVVEFYEGDTWEDMVTKYSPTLYLIGGKYVGFSSEGMVYDPTTNKTVQKTDQLVPNRAYYIQ